MALSTQDYSWCLDGGSRAKEVEAVTDEPKLGRGAGCSTRWAYFPIRC
jgi:hypothetical protein